MVMIENTIRIWPMRSLLGVTHVSAKRVAPSGLCARSLDGLLAALEAVGGGRMNRSLRRISPLPSNLQRLCFADGPAHILSAHQSFHLVSDIRLEDWSPRNKREPMPVFDKRKTS